MKKSFLILKLLSVIFAAGIFYSCDSGGGGGGGGSSGGGNSTGSADVKITIPKSTSSDINILGDFQPSDADNFYYEIYYSKPDGSSKSSSQFAHTGGTVTFSKVKYDTYTFFLKIWVDSRMKQVLTTDSKTVAVSESESKVEFPDRSVSDYKNWYFVLNAEQLTETVITINSSNSYNESNKAIICLRDNIELPDYKSILASVSSKAEVKYNGWKIAEQLFNVNISGSITGGTVTALPTKAAFGETVKLTVTPNETPQKYKFKSLTFGSEEPVTELADDGICTFVMPSNDVTVTAEFIPVYTITYDLNGGTASDFEETVEYTKENFTDGVYTLLGKEKVSKEGGYLFYGWYEEENFSGSKVTEINVSDIEDKIFHARWVDSIYVKDGGSSSNDGLSEGKAVGTLADAINKINDYAIDLENTSFAWKIQIVSDLLEAQDMSKATVNAYSITVEGNGHTLDASSSGDRGLIIQNTSIPITIKNLTITGGSESHGAGVLAKGSPVKLTLSTGVVVTQNTYDGASSYGTGVCAENGATVTITENAEISNNVSSNTGTCTTYGGGVCALSATVIIEKNAKITGNKARYGAGVCCYNPGSVTISDNVTISNNTYPDDGIPDSGGGLYITGSGASVTMNGGTISSNTNGSGGGVYNGATFTLNGGTISGNTLSPTTNNGTGVLNAGTFKMNGGTIASGNDIYLTDGSGTAPTIEVGGTISSQVDVKLASSRCNSGEAVLTGSGAAANYTNFNLTNAGLYKIGSAGTLVQKDLNDFTNADIDYCVTQLGAVTINNTSSKDYSLSNLANKTKLILYKGAGADAGDGTVYPYYGIIKIVTGSSSPSTISFNGNDSDYTLDWNQSSWQAWDLKRKSIAGFVDVQYDFLYFFNPNLQIYPGSGSGTTSLSIYEIDL